MCCDGTLFRVANIEEKDLPLAGKLGMEVIRNDEVKLQFKQPCPQFNQCCTVYDKPKPSICSEYRCTLLNSLDKDFSLLDEVTQTVRKARLLQEAINKAYPDAETSPISFPEVAARAAALSADSDTRKDNAQFLMAAAAFITHLQKYFYK